MLPGSCRSQGERTAAPRRWARRRCLRQTRTRPRKSRPHPWSRWFRQHPNLRHPRSSRHAECSQGKGGGRTFVAVHGDRASPSIDIPTPVSEQRSLRVRTQQRYDSAILIRMQTCRRCIGPFSISCMHNCKGVDIDGKRGADGVVFRYILKSKHLGKHHPPTHQLYGSQYHEIW